MHPSATPPRTSDDSSGGDGAPTPGQRDQRRDPPLRTPWPDHDASRTYLQPVADDVSGLNGLRVGRIVSARSPSDVIHAVQLARSLALPLAMRGTQHTMGGHSLPPSQSDGLILDLKLLNHVTYDVAASPLLVTCGPGALWSDVIRCVNQNGKSPRTMQSYSSFSVGGTLSANAHGITTDECLAESVAYVDVVTADGRLVTHCQPNGGTEEQRELFRYVLGGYGLFGVIVGVCLRLDDNHALETDTITVSKEQFPQVFAGLQMDPAIDVKISRLDITTLDTVTIYAFRRISETPTVSRLDAEARKMGLMGRLMYKWLAPTAQEIRFAFEQMSGSPLDWAESSDRNSLMFESAEPMARLATPLFTTDDTFILQEYFVPRERFAEWIDLVKPIYAWLNAVRETPAVASSNDGSDATATSSAGNTEQGGDATLPAASYAPLVSLLNTTIRFVKRDSWTALPYSSHESGSYSFVLYYRIHRTPEADAVLRDVHHQFTEATLSLGGTFYLPYRHHYTDEQLRAAYPTMDAFVEAKRRLDPSALFQNMWSVRYLPKTTAAGGGTDVNQQDRRALLWGTPDHSEQCSSGNGGGAFAPPVVSVRREDSYHRLLNDAHLRTAFKGLFLTRVFNVQNSALVFQRVLRAYYSIRGGSRPPTDAASVQSGSKKDAHDPHDDNAIYELLYDDFQRTAGGLEKILGQVRSVWQLSAQKAQLTEELSRLLHRLGVPTAAGPTVHGLRDYLSVGDQGKMVLSLRSALGLSGAVYIANDVNTEGTVANAVERGTPDPVGEFIPLNFCDGRVRKVPTASVDLVTIMQGLHHFHPDALPTFLAEVHRVLRPGGLFIVREHDARAELMPMLDLAHSVFNAVTGVDPKTDRAEVRAFRPVSSWIDLVQRCGHLVDAKLYERQSDDPTIDEMLCVYKPPFRWTHVPAPRTSPADAAAAEAREATRRQGPCPLPRHPNIAEAENLSSRALKIANEALPHWRKAIDRTHAALLNMFDEAQRPVVRAFTAPLVQPAQRAISRLIPLLRESIANSGLPSTASGVGGSASAAVFGSAAGRLVSGNPGGIFSVGSACRRGHGDAGGGSGQCCRHSNSEGVHG